MYQIFKIYESLNKSDAKIVGQDITIIHFNSINYVLIHNKYINNTKQ